MSKELHRFRKAEIERALKAVTAAGLSVSLVRIGPEGQLELETAGPPAPAEKPADEWKVA